MASVAMCRNISFAAAQGLRDLIAGGTVLQVRGNEARELRNHVTTLSRPLERCPFLPHRNNNIFATLAETLWVLAGRADIVWLEHYLPRAGEFSDDGQIWRAAYGPRLRNWNGVDQLSESRRLLLEDQLTRRAVMSLFDPDRDFVESKDIPCNNWLHWLVRDGNLHLNIAVRSNDVVWGFSGINSFEWSVLHELMATWIGVPVGDQTFFASSFHLYQRHYTMSERLVADFEGITCYDFGLVPPSILIPWQEFDSILGDWFAREDRIRNAPEQAAGDTGSAADPFLGLALQLLRIYTGAKRGWETSRLSLELAVLPETDLTAAAYEFFGRKHPEVLQSIPQPSIAAFFDAYMSKGRSSSIADLPKIRLFVKDLHRRKNSAYGTAWKRRGELLSILANIARKVDRLNHYCPNDASLADESIVDTAVDLLVYSVKYQLYLMDLAPELAKPHLPPTAGRPFSDAVSHFDALLDQIQLSAPERRPSIVVQQIAGLFEVLHHEAIKPGSLPSDRFSIARTLSERALQLTVAFARAAWSDEAPPFCRVL